MPLANAETIADHTGLEAAAAARAAARARAAEVEARRLLGREYEAAWRYDTNTEVYDFVLDHYGEIPTGNAETDTAYALDYEDLEEAESLLSVALALPLLNLRPSEKGGLVTAVGFDQSRQEFLGPSGIRELQAAIRKQAHALLGRLLDRHATLYDRQEPVYVL